MKGKKTIVYSILATVLLMSLVAATTIISNTGSKFGGELDMQGNEIVGVGKLNVTDLNVNGTFITKDPYVDIRAFGAVGDGVTDDTLAFNQIESGMTVLVPKGIYSVGRINITSNNITIRCIDNDHSILKLKDGADSMMFHVTGKWFKLENCNINGNNHNIITNQTLILTGWYANDISIIGNKIYNASGSSVYINAARNAKINNNIISNSGTSLVEKSQFGMGIQLNSCSNCEIKDNIIDTFYGDGGIFTADTSTGSGYSLRNLLISNNRIMNGKSNQASAVHIFQGSHIYLSDNLYLNMDLSSQGINGFFSGTSTSHIKISGDKAINISGNGFELGGSYSELYDFTVIGYTNNSCCSDGQGVYVSGSNSKISNGIIDSPAQHGIYITQNANHSSIDNVHIFNVNKTSDGAGIRLVINSNSTGIKIRNNAVINNSDDVNTLYGIYKTGTGSLLNTEIYGNSYVGSGTAISGVTQTLNLNTLNVETITTNYSTITSTEDVSSQGLIVGMNFNSDTISDNKIIDSSSSNNHGIMRNSPTLSNSGGFNDGGYISFNGVNQTVNITNNAGLSPHILGDATWSIWVKPDINVTTNTYIIAKGIESNYEYGLFMQSDRRLSFAIWSKSGETHGVVTSPNNRFNASGDWYHVVATYRNNESLQLYVNGILEYNQTANSSVITEFTAIDLRLGQRMHWEGYYNGSMDDFRMYNRALSESEIMALYHMKKEIHNPFVNKINATFEGSINGNVNFTGNISAGNIFINGNLNVTGCIIYNSSGTPQTLGTCV